MRTWASDAGVDPPGLSIDRDAGEGPPRCCRRRRVAADALVFYGGLPAGIRGRVLGRFPRLAEISPEERYLCDGCRETLRRERVIARTEMPLSRPLQLPDVI